ncbi:TetR/AcrR family transcriptional regulator C-terminal domain-containing protein [Leucobacter tardus]|uniref:TetR/AcrR family transcriptional regulator C-terminal domain-containing protein n=1 Tax=Leucobacter tardus TaxID=501483 RepID=A0A939TLW9_9MICO|nr:TetR/AcrR family transcriptional regulator C-terminal domain-containing protein [Leucobacter tardus]MBO2988559.1 TetR/AcrR family transcriptional regulator C-terminal domain-containing protein [Leucobacter tardus]
MAGERQRGVGRPNENVLSRVLIVETALDLLDLHGRDGFGMRDIARRLGVRPSALYNHVASKDDVFRGIREVIATRITVAPFVTQRWDEALITWAHSYREVFASHPPTIALLAVMPFETDSEIFGTYEQVIEVLYREGWERAEALNILVAMESFILGSALDAAAPADMMSPGDRADIPHFSAAYAERDMRTADSGAGPADQAFEAGLNLLIAGLEAQRSARAASRVAHDR